MSQTQFKRIDYRSLNSRQKENFNYQKISAVLADYGYVTHRLSDDWQGADFIAQHKDGGQDFLKIQLKGRLTFDEKYRGKNIWIAFPEGDGWFVFPHDEVLDVFLRKGRLAGSTSWDDRGGYSFPYVTADIRPILQPYRLPLL